MKILPDFTFIKYLNNTVAIIFIVCLTIIAILYLILRHLRKQKEEDDIHNEILDQNRTHKKIMQMYYSNQTSIPPPNDNVIFFEKYKRTIESEILNERENVKYRSSSPVRNKKTNRIKSFYIKKGVN